MDWHFQIGKAGWVIGPNEKGGRVLCKLDRFKNLKPSLSPEGVILTLWRNVRCWVGAAGILQPWEPGPVLAQGSKPQFANRVFSQSSLCVGLSYGNETFVVLLTLPPHPSSSSVEACVFLAVLR